MKTIFRSVEEIAEGMRTIVRLIKTCEKGPAGTAPKILIIAPPPFVNSPLLHDQFNEHSIEKSKNIAAAYQIITKEEGCEFLDASQIVISSHLDGVHLEETQCALLGEAVGKKVEQLF